eukprot:3692902-Amphidinium_carterae.1
MFAAFFCKGAFSPLRASMSAHIENGFRMMRVQSTNVYARASELAVTGHYSLRFSGVGRVMQGESGNPAGDTA